MLVTIAVIKRFDGFRCVGDSISNYGSFSFPRMHGDGITDATNIHIQTTQFIKGIFGTIFGVRVSGDTGR